MTNKSAYVKDWRRRTKRNLLEGFKSKCGICGYDKCVAALEFHHIDPSQKEFTFGDISSRSWDHIVKEISKCACLCANCHREVHYGSTIITEEVQRFDPNLITYEKWKTTKQNYP